MQMTPFGMIRDINGFNGFGLPFSNTKFRVLLSQGVEKTVTIPSTNDPRYKNVFVVFCNFGSSIWVAPNATATIPSETDFTQTDSEENPQARQVQPGDVLHFITNEVSASAEVICYAIP